MNQYKEKYTDPWTFTSEDNIKEYTILNNSSDIDPLMDRIGDSRFVLLGEATHGTHEFYTWRTAITKRLIMEKNIKFIAVEGDWPDCFRINQYIKGYPDAPSNVVEVLNKFKRWPTWMWANWEIVSLLEWLKEYNKNLPEYDKIGFYGLDVYSLWESLEVMMDYLQQEDPKVARLARQVFKCFEPYEQGQQYPEAVHQVTNSCTDKVIRLLADVRKNAPHYDNDPEAGLNANINATVVSDAEKYYRSMTSFDELSWNIRDAHMFATLEELMNFHGHRSKCVVWEHNTHIGDARATDMANSGLLNVGQLVREKYSQEGVILTGFSTYQGRVIAGRHWGAEMEEMIVPPAKSGSVEEMLHRDTPQDKLLVFDRNPVLRERFSTWYRQRAIGVVYRPEYEKRNYVPAILAERYDSLIYIDITTALNPLVFNQERRLPPDTYPFGI